MNEVIADTEVYFIAKDNAGTNANVLISPLI